MFQLLLSLFLVEASVWRTADPPGVFAGECEGTQTPHVCGGKGVTCPPTLFTCCKRKASPHPAEFDLIL